MLQFTGHDSLAVEVGNLLDLERTWKKAKWISDNIPKQRMPSVAGGSTRTFERSGILSATSQKEQTLLILEELGAHLLDRLIQLQNLAELVRDLAETLNDLLAALLLRRTVLAQGQGEHDHGHELRGVCLGGGHTNLGTSVDVHTAVGQEGDGGADDVDDTDGQGATLQTVAQSHEGIGSLAGLRHKYASVITEDGSLTIQEVGGQLHCNGDLRQLLKHTTHRHARVVAGTAGDEDQTTTAANGGDVLAKTTQSDHLVRNVQTTTHGVDHGLGLLEDLLLHEVVELALHDLLELQLDGLNGTDVGGAVVLGESVDVELSIVDVSNVIVLEVEHLLGVLDDGGGIRGQEELGGLGDSVVGQERAGLRTVQEGLVGRSQQTGGRLLESDVLGGLLRGKRAIFREFDIDKVHLHLLGGAHTDDQGRTLAGRNDLMGVVNRLEQQTESAFQLLDHRLGEDGELNVRVLVVQVLGQLGDTLGVGLGLEAEALALQQGLQFLVVGDDTIVNDGELPGGVRSGADTPRPLVSDSGLIDGELW